MKISIAFGVAKLRFRQALDSVKRRFRYFDWTDAFLKTALGVVVIILILAAVREIPYDDTDNVDTGKRSGMGLYTDHGTGCQYLGRSGSLTPRLNKDGKHICK